MIVRCRVPLSKKARAMMKARPKTSMTRDLTNMWGRRGCPGIATVASSYRSRG